LQTVDRTDEQVAKGRVGLDELPEWNFDGSSTGQAPGNNSDVYLRPVAIYDDPFRGKPNVLVMCETWMSDGKPNAFNFRHDAALLMEANASEGFWFGLEQEYTLLDVDGWPFGWPKNGFPAPQGPTTAVSAPAKCSAVTSSRLTTWPASTLASTSRVPTPRSCPPSGSTRSAPAPASTVSALYYRQAFAIETDMIV
jgi:glutamine synthetase